MFWQQVLNGLSLGSVYALVALGFVILWKSAEVLNFAQGDFMMVGAFLSFTFIKVLGMPIWLSFILSILLVGLLGGLAQYLMTLSYQRLAIATVSPLKYLTIVFSGVIGYLIWGDIPDLQSLCGIALIIATGLYTLHRELTLKSR